MLKPLNDKVLVLPDDKIKEVAGLLLPESAQKQPQEGTVMAVGKKVKHIKVKDRVILVKHRATEIKYNDQDLLIIAEDDIFGLL